MQQTNGEHEEVGEAKHKSTFRNDAFSQGTKDSDAVVSPVYMIIWKVV